MAEAREAAQKNLDNLFAAHISTAVFAGVTTLLFPRLWLSFLHEQRPINEAGYEVGDLLIRMYGSLIVAQAWLVHNTRRSRDAKIRKAFVEAYTAAFGLTFACLVHAHFFGGHFTNLNLINIGMFLGLFGGYGYFAFFEKISTFEEYRSDV